MQICTGLVYVILGNRVGILTSVLIAMDCFFRCQKSSMICQENVFVDQATGSTYSGIIFKYKDLYKTLKEIGKNQFVSELKEFCYICKFLNFTGVFAKKNLKLSKLEYNSLHGKVNLQ